MTKSSKRWSGLSYDSCTAYQQYLTRRDLAESASLNKVGAAGCEASRENPVVFQFTLSEEGKCADLSVR